MKEAGVLITMPWDGGEIHEPTVQCVHCGAHHVVEAAFKRAVLGQLGFCAKCNGITCGEKCQKCVPAEKQLEVMEGTVDLTDVSVGVLWPIT